MIPVTSYRELVEGIKHQVASMQVSYADFDELACFPDGLTGKIFGPAQVKRLGAQKMFDAIRAAGLRLHLEIDEKQLMRMLKQIEQKGIKPRRVENVRTNHAHRVSIEQIHRVMRHLAKLGVEGRMTKMTAQARSDHARHAANKRWQQEQKRRARQRRKSHKQRRNHR